MPSNRDRRFQPLSVCPVTGLPVYRRDDWCFSDPQGNYELRISLVGDRIVWLQSQGYARFEYVRGATALLGRVLRTAMPKEALFVLMDDHTAITGGTLDARRYIFHTLRSVQRLKAYIVCGPSRSFGFALRMAGRLGVFPFEVVLADDAMEAAAIAFDRATRLEAPVGDFQNPGGALRNGTEDAGEGQSLEFRALEDYADEMLAFVGGIHLESYGHSPTFKMAPLEHPFRPVYDALTVLRDDLQAILQRHRETRERLERRETELTAKQSMLNESLTTLNILLADREASRQRLARRVEDRFRALVKPLADGFERSAHTLEEKERLDFLEHVVRHIAAPMPWEGTEVPTAFTPRERLIACLLTTGREVHAIARILGLSRRTVENHCQRMRVKMGLRGRRVSLRDGLVRKPAARRLRPGIADESC